MTHRRCRGQATVEVALALPVVLVALLAVVQAGLVVAEHVRTVHVAREAARAAAVDAAPGAATDAAVDAGGGRCRVRADRPRRVGAVLRVEVTCPAPTRVPLVGPLLPDREVRARAAMRVER